MSNSAVERVARALCIDHGEDPDANFYHGMSDTVSKVWEGYISMAEVAIAAMAEDEEWLKSLLPPLQKTKRPQND